MRWKRRLSYQNTMQKKEHYEQVCEMDSKFHKLLYKASGSRILEHTLTDFHQYVQRVRMASIMKKRRMEKSNDEHDAILTAIREHDEEKAGISGNSSYFKYSRKFKKL